MKKILFNTMPAIRSYLGDAFCFSIINDFAFKSGWVYDKYIDIQYTPYDRQIKYAAYDYYDFVPDQGVFVKSFTEIPIEDCKKGYICRMVEKMIDEGEYFFALWDETIITNYLFSQNEKGVYEHGCFVYGYDSDSKLFYSQGYIGGERWKKITIPYDIFFEALSYYPQKGEIAFIGYQLVEGYVWKFDFLKMIQCLYIYEDTKRKLYNTSAEICFFNDILKFKSIHYPSVYCIWEHKKIMRMRIQFLLKNNYLKKYDELISIAYQIEEDAKIILQLTIKYNLTYNDKILLKILHKSNEMIEKEYELIGQLKMCLNY